MVTSAAKQLDNFGKFILRTVYPHEHNDHQPWFLRSEGLLLFLVVLIVAQAATNVSSASGRVLGFATNISVSEVINLTNSERASSGLGPLKTNSSLSKAAELKAKDMFQKDYWAHFAPDGTSPWYFFGLVTYKYTWAGENLARDFATSTGVVAAWMDSSGHRANILSPNFSETGVAVVNGNLEGEDTTLVVQLFGKPVSVAAAGEQSGSTDTSAGQAATTRVEARLNLPSESKETRPAGFTTAGKNIVPASGTESTSNELSVISLVKNATNSQKVTLSLLLIIAALFVFDSFVIFRRRHVRANSHSLSHAGMILLLIAITLLYGKGAIL
jgi:uncharacterized protein YkwD